MSEDPELPSIEALRASAGEGGMRSMDMIDEELRDALIEFLGPMQRFVEVVASKAGRDSATAYVITTVIKTINGLYEQ